jgi:putative acetyltransferase
MNLTIRPIQSDDNVQIAKVIRTALEDFGANKPGTAYFDETTDDLYALFQTKDSAYFIAELDGEIIGGSGLFPTENLPEGHVELVKIYINKAARGKGVGRLLMETCFEEARKLNYTHLYLESMPELNVAVGMYHKMGFKSLDKPLGNSGHFGCNLWMVKEL